MSAGDAGGEQGFAAAGVAAEEGDGSLGDAVLPEPDDFLSGNLGEVEAWGCCGESEVGGGLRLVWVWPVGTRCASDLEVGVDAGQGAADGVFGSSFVAHFIGDEGGGALLVLVCLSWMVDVRTMVVAVCML